MALRHAVITSVDRDDLADGGAFIFAETIRRTRERASPTAASRCSFPTSRVSSHHCAPCSTQAQTCSITTSRPSRVSIAWLDRVESYRRSLELLDRSRHYRPSIATKTGIMVGLGEEHR